VLTQALERGGSLYAASLLAHCRAELCRWEGLAELHASVAKDLSAAGGETMNAFAALSIPLSPLAQLHVAQRWAGDLAPPVRPPPTPRQKSNAAARLRLGYVSSDFRKHAMTSLLTEVWERHDRARLETFAYSLVPPEPSAFGARVAGAFEHFVDVSAQPAAGIARRIRSDGVDVLVDLNGYTTHAKSEIFALRPAPLQISWLGYLGTLGAPWYDYVLTDRFVAPAALQPFFTERFLYLPDCYCPSDTRRTVAEAVPSRAACGLPERGRVFCCFNNSYKILPEVFAVWMRLLAATPGSVLWLAPGNATAKTSLRREAQARGVDPERLVFAARVSLPEHLARHAHAELFLDTSPYNAGTTANDALFMGVPVLTCSGASMVSRVAGSQLRAIGLPELVTTSLEEYEALALKLAAESELLAAYRARLATNRNTHPLFDMTRFTRNLDDLLCNAWENRDSAAR
jgi:protein O-GlcNAc transferase